jgi:murein hydrolase activator
MNCRASSLLSCAALLLALPASPGAQSPERPRSDAQVRRVDERIRVLQLEAERLAREAQTLLGDLRKLEVERDLRAEEAIKAESAADDAQRALQTAVERLASLEQQRLAQLPDIKNQLVDIYKRGNTEYIRLLFGADDLRDFARATRAAGALAAINERRITEHRRTLDALGRERAALERTTADRQAQEAAATQARLAAERAVGARAALLARIDSRRDLTAQYVGELQGASDRLQQVPNMTGGRPGDPPAATSSAVPLGPFRGVLDWPVAGRISGRFGQAAGRLGGTAGRNGMELGAVLDAPVRAVHSGTVAFADAFVGFGMLVIVDHGRNDYSLYGYLGATAVRRGDIVESGAELGRVGLAPAGPPALYFEMRIDGRSVDPVQWLRPR